MTLIMDFLTSTWQWLLCCRCWFFRNYLAPVATLERIIGVYNWTMCRFRSNSSSILL